MRIGVAQLHTRAGDLPGTVARIEAQARAAADRGVELLVFPVPTVTGPVPLPLGAQDAFLLDALGELEGLAGRLACPCLVPLVIDLDDRVMCEAVLLEGGAASPLRLTALASVLLGDDDPPPEVPPLTVEVSGTRLGLAFLPDEIDALVREECPVDVIIYLAQYGFAFDDPASDLGAFSLGGRPVIAERAFGTWMVGVGAIGGYGAQVFTGSSFAVAPDGALVAQAPSFEEALMVADVGGAPAGEGIRPEPYDGRYHLWQALALGLRDYVEALGAPAVVLALDGSVSASALAVLASDALGPRRVHVLQAAGGDRDCASLVRDLHVEAHEAAPPARTIAASDAMQLELASLARRLGALCLSSVDKTGLALEATDSLVYARTLAPLADVWRSDVLDMAHLRNAVSPVFASLALGPQDMPSCVPVRADTQLEPLLRRVDDILAAHLAGFPHGVQEASVELAELVLDAWRARELAHSACPPCLAMSTVMLREASLPAGFAWRGAREGGVRAAGPALEAALRKLVGAADDEAPQAGDGWRGSALSGPSVAGALNETFELLRDLSTGGDLPDWRGPFSEN